MHSPLVSSCIFTCISATAHPYITCVSACLSDDSICRAASSPRSKPRQLSDRLCGRVNAMSCWTIWDGSARDSRYGRSSWLIWVGTHITSYTMLPTPTHTHWCMHKKGHTSCHRACHSSPQEAAAFGFIARIDCYCGWVGGDQYVDYGGREKGGKVLCAVPPPAPASPISSLLCHLCHTAPDHHWLSTESPREERY